ncbi:MAG: lytic transglycosylase domain-containing protein [Actinomycetota bacterium]
MAAVFAAGLTGVGGAAYLSGFGSFAGADRAGAAVAGIPSSRSIALLERNRQHLILMDAATKTLSVVGTPKLATTPVAPPATPLGGAAPGSPAPTVNAPAPDPGTAQAIAYQMLPSFGWKASTYYGCLDNIWSRESGWRYNAENASGAYGIPQALPGSKMATAGADWATNPATQIKWGMGYIQGRYGNPCSAWAFWEAHSWY